MAKRFVLSGYFGFKNFGDEEILSVLVNKLQNDRNTISIISSDTEYTKSKFRHVNSFYTFDILNILCLIRKSDVLVSGGGSLLQDVTSFKSLVYYLFIIFIALCFRKKVIIFAQGIGPINNILGRFLTKSILKHCFYISVRDNKSQELLSNWGIKADLLCDPIFCIKMPILEKTKTVAIQLRNFRSMNEEFINKLATKVCENFSDYEIEILPFQNSIDLEVCKNFEKAIKFLNANMKVTLFDNLDNKEIINRLAKSQYLIGMRFHSIIAGLLAKCKVLSINYDIKVEKISKEFNLPMVDLNKEFGNSFDKLKNLDVEQTYSIVQQKQFDWTGFEKSI